MIFLASRFGEGFTHMWTKLKLEYFMRRGGCFGWNPLLGPALSSPLALIPLLLPTTNSRQYNPIQEGVWHRVARIQHLLASGLLKKARLPVAAVVLHSVQVLSNTPCSTILPKLWASWLISKPFCGWDFFVAVCRFVLLRSPAAQFSFGHAKLLRVW